MAVYRQILQAEENGILVTEELIISDDYPSIFNPVGAIDVDIFEFGTSKKDLDKNGAQQDDQFDFTLHAGKILTTDEQNCLTFILEAESLSRWCGYFIHETAVYTSGDLNDKEFSGKILPKLTGTDVKWDGAQWNDSPAPLREWKISAQTFSSAILDSCKLEDETVEGVINEGLLTQMLSDATWVHDCVKTRLSSRWRLDAMNVED